MHAVASGAEAVRGADIVNVITKAATPVLEGKWLEPGQHINAAGSNALTRRELRADAVKRCAPVVVDSRGTARNESGDLLPLVDTGLLDWDTLPELGEVIVGRMPGARRTMRSRSTSRTACISRISIPGNTCSRPRCNRASASICRSACKVADVVQAPRTGNEKSLAPISS